MVIRSTLNGGLAEVDDEFGAQLIESGQWEAASAAKPRTRKKSAPVEEPKPEE